MAETVVELFLLRHGEAAGDPHAHCQPPVTGFLSEIGQDQADDAGRRLAEVAFDGVYCSPLGRAIQTAQSFAHPQSLRLVKDLMEWRPACVLNPGTHAPEDSAQYERIMAEAALLPPEQCWKTPAGEGTLEMYGRIIPALLAILKEHGIEARHGGYVLREPASSRGARLALVAHGGSLGCVLAFLLGVPIRPFAPISFEHAGLAVVRFIRRADVWFPSLVIPRAAAPAQPASVVPAVTAASR